MMNLSRPLAGSRPFGPIFSATSSAQPSIVMLFNYDSPPREVKQSMENALKANLNSRLAIKDVRFEVRDDVSEVRVMFHGDTITDSAEDMIVSEAQQVLRDGGASNVELGGYRFTV